jgi:hypothetical protein
VQQTRVVVVVVLRVRGERMLQAMACQQQFEVHWQCTQ